MTGIESGAAHAARMCALNPLECTRSGRSALIADRNVGTCESAAIPARPSPATNFAVDSHVAPPGEFAAAESPNRANVDGYSIALAATPISRAASSNGPSSPAISDNPQWGRSARRSEEHTSELQSRQY